MEKFTYSIDTESKERHALMDMDGMAFKQEALTACVDGIIATFFYQAGKAKITMDEAYELYQRNLDKIMATIEDSMRIESTISTKDGYRLRIEAQVEIELD